MMGGARVYLAFRIFGNFHWPPVRDDFDISTDDTGKALQKGVVEIYYTAPDPGKPDDLAAFLRWTSRTSDTDPSVPPRFDGDISQAVDIQAQNDVLKNAFQNPNALFRLTGSAAQVGKARRLLFRGAFLFDQFSFDPKQNDNPSTDLRWALARTYRHYSKNGVFGSSFFSEVVIGQEGDDLDSGASIRLNLALPTPGAQSGDDTHRCYALPFGAIFAPKLKLSNPPVPAAPPVRQFVAGPGPADSLQDSPGVPVTTARVEHTQLGHFGFCAGVNAGGRQFLYFPRHGGDFKTFWPTSPRAFIEDFLCKLSRSAQPEPNPEQRLALNSDPTNSKGEFVHSVRFRTDSGKTVMTFRTTVTMPEPLVNFNKPGLLTDDIRVDWNSLGALRPYSFQLRVPGGTGKWLHIRNDTLIVERQISYQVADKAIWSLLGTPSSGGDITVRLGFSERQDDADPLPDTIRIKDLLAPAQQAMPLARFALRNIGDGQPQSILPDINIGWPDLPANPAPGEGPRTARFMFCGKMFFSFRPSAKADGPLFLNRAYPRREIWAGLDIDLSLWPTADAIATEDVLASLDVIMSMASFAYDSHPLQLALINDPSAPSGDELRWCRFRITSPAPFATALTARLGGLEFGAPAGFGRIYPEPSDVPSDYSYWRFGHRVSKPPLQPANVDFRARLSIATVRPIVADTPWGDRSGAQAPLLIPLGADAGAGSFILDLREAIAQRQDRQLIAAIYDIGGGAGDSGDYVILSEEPFSLIRVHAQPLQDRGTQDNALVATFDSDTRQWQVKLVAETYHYVFPPQVAGESMDKPKRLEVADDVVPSHPSITMPPARRPQDKDGRPFPVEFRLTPSAEVWIQPSDLDRGYFLPEWASHEIFRQRGDLGIGAALAALRGEFLYGLSVGVDPSRESGASRSARIAEIEALVGRPPSKLGLANTSTALPVRWSALDQAIARRPERMEIWARDLNSTVPLAPASFSGGVTFALRETALHRPAVPLADDELEGLDQPNTGKPRISEFGLSGGALWPLESKNFFNSLVQNPTSVGGTIEQLALSPIGGDANQNAEFLNGKVRIISETRNGFVQRHKVEIIGRISVFWHWAKYVVVYERTVNPSAQFTPDGGVGDRTRRPVLRKVSEYVYIRQPQGIRRYPDFPTAKASSSGLLKAVKFNSITINVDSAWSEDVGQYGWQIPLWNRSAARRRPQVYPRPDVAFSTYAEGQGEEAETSQECLDPDNIYFYADASPNTSDDTDSWPSLAAIDCSLLPPPSDDFQRALDPDGQPDNGTNTKPGAVRIPRGHSRFTWRLSPPSKKTALNAGRSEKPLFAGLASITFMRSNAPEPTDANKVAVKAMTDALKLADTVSPPAVKPAYWFNGKNAPAAFSEVNDFRGAVAAQNSADVKTTVNKLAAALTNQIRSRPGIKESIAAATANAQKLNKIAQFVATPLTSRCQQMTDDLVGSIQRKQLLIVDAVSTWQAQAEAVVPQAPPQPKTTDKLIDYLISDSGLGTAVHRVFGEIGNDLGQINLGAEKARGILNDFENDVRETAENLQTQLSALKAAYDDDKPWSDSRIEDFETKWLATGNRVLNGITTAIEEGCARVNTELDDLAQTIANALHDAMQSLSSAGSSLNRDISSACALPASYLDAAIARLSNFLSTGNGKDALGQLDDKLAAFQSSIQVQHSQQAAEIGDVRQQLSTIRTSAQAVLTFLQNIKANNPQTKIADLVDATVQQGDAILTGIAAAVDHTRATLAEITDDALRTAIDALQVALTDFTQFVDTTVSIVRDFGSAIDGVVDAAYLRIDTALNGVLAQIDGWFELIDDAAQDVSGMLDDLTQEVNNKIPGIVTDNILRPALKSALTEVTDEMIDDYANNRARIVTLIGDTSGYVQAQLGSVGASVLGDVRDDITGACNGIARGLDQALGYFQHFDTEIQNEATAVVNKWQGQVLQYANDFATLAKIADDFTTDVRRLNNEISTSYASARGYGNRVLQSAGNLGAGGIGAAPGNILRLYAAVASAPSLPNLDFARDRLGYYYNQLNDIIDTTPAEAWFGRLGDELKALGLSLPFRQIAEGILPDDLSNFDISRIFRNFSGMKLDTLFQGYKLPPGARDAIKLTHAFDSAQARAWVEIDIDLPMADRKAMFTVGPFELDYVDSRLVATVRLEASKDTNTVDQIGRATLTTDFEAVVAGETMVTFQQVALHYEKSTGLKIEFDPKKIRLNAIFQFVQDTLGSIFPDELGGLKVIKDDYGIPVGVEHEFSMPPISVDFATSGISDLVINNRFGLVAFPEFVIYDRFSLSRPELPFIFSIFVIGGTGYITIDAEYRPFQQNGLMVVVEAAAGGSAQIGFAFGPVSGQVFITLSVALAYTKVFGKPGGGLTISLVLVVAGNVDIAGIVTIYIGLLLRMSYQDNGAIDATGTLTVTIHITRFFKIEVNANVHYQLRGGQSQTTTSVHTGAGVDPSALSSAKAKADRLLSARG